MVNRIDPWKNIVNVGWGGAWLACSINFFGSANPFTSYSRTFSITAGNTNPVDPATEVDIEFSRSLSRDPNDTLSDGFNSSPVNWGLVNLNHIMGTDEPWVDLTCISEGTGRFFWWFELWEKEEDWVTYDATTRLTSPYTAFSSRQFYFDNFGGVEPADPGLFQVMKISLEDGLVTQQSQKITTTIRLFFDPEDYTDNPDNDAFSFTLPEGDLGWRFQRQSETVV